MDAKESYIIHTDRQYITETASGAIDDGTNIYQYEKKPGYQWQRR